MKKKNENRKIKISKFENPTIKEELDDDGMKVFLPSFEEDPKSITASFENKLRMKEIELGYSKLSPNKIKINWPSPQKGHIIETSDSIDQTNQSTSKNDLESEKIKPPEILSKHLMQHKYVWILNSESKIIPDPEHDVSTMYPRQKRIISETNVASYNLRKRIFKTYPGAIKRKRISNLNLRCENKSEPELKTVETKCDPEAINFVLRPSENVVPNAAKESSDTNYSSSCTDSGDDFTSEGSLSKHSDLKQGLCNDNLNIKEEFRDTKRDVLNQMSLESNKEQPINSSHNLKEKETVRIKEGFSENNPEYFSPTYEKPFKIEYASEKQVRIDHSYVRTPTCFICHANFEDENLLNLHEAEHEKTKFYPHRCAICLKRFSCASQLAQHNVNNHNPKNPFSCSICPCKFRSRMSLYYHNAVHRNERKFECNLCPKKYNIKSHLTQHMKSHAPKTHACKFCNETFKQDCLLKQHISLCHDTKPFKCPFCPSAYKWEKCLEIHLSTHFC